MSIGVWQIALIALVIVVLFGAGKIPRLMRDMGQGIRSFKEGLNEESAKLEEPTDKTKS